MSADLTGQRLGHYLVQSILGHGGMSTVYRALDERLDRPVALKVISEHLSSDDEFRQRFVEEARAASAIDHVNVVPLYDFGEAEGWLFIAMRLVDGTDLAREVADGPLAQKRVIDLLGQVGEALDMLHERGLVHLDVKPANVLITRNESVGREHVYLADFGLTRRGTSGHRTSSGDFLGSPTYASPEHLRGDPVLPAADLYALTCVLFTCLAGRAPFIGTVKEVVSGHLRGQVPSLSALTGLPSSIDRVIARGLAADPTLRYPSSAELLGSARRALTSYSDADPVEATPRAAPSPSEPDPMPDHARAPDPAPAPSASAPESASPAEPAGPVSRAAQPLLGRSVNDPTPPKRPSGLVAPPGSTPPQFPPPPRQGQQGPQQPGQQQPGPQQGHPQQGPPQQGPGQPGRQDQGSRRHRAPQRHSPWPWIAVVLALLIAAAVGVIVLTSAEDPAPTPLPTPPSSAVGSAPSAPPSDAPSSAPESEQTGSGVLPSIIDSSRIVILSSP